MRRRGAAADIGETSGTEETSKVARYELWRSARHTFRTQRLPTHPAIAECRDHWPPLFLGRSQLSIRVT
jgi:hypothetical protein